MASEIKVDTISEKTSAGGVTIDGLLIKDGGISGDVSLIGTTPTFTIGDAGAEDAALVFDGNAQDFYMALDDSADDLVIGLGNAVGTTPLLSFTEGGAATFKNVGTGDDNPMTLTLQTAETDMAANDVIGAINFQAPDEGTGTDAILVAAGIEAVSEGDFSSSANATKLSFKTAASEAAAEKMSLSSGGNLVVSGTIKPTSGLTDGTVTKSKIVHHRWKLTSNFSTSTGVEALTAGWSSVEAIGTAMSESSGVFTFPHAGLYKISLGIHGASSAASAYRGGGIQRTADDSTYSATGSLFFTSTGANTYWNARQVWIFDCVSTSTHKVRFQTENAAGGTVSNGTNVVFDYLGDT